MPSSCTAKRCEREHPQGPGARWHHALPALPSGVRESQVRLACAADLHTWRVELLSTEAEKGQVGVWPARARYSGVLFRPLWWRY